MSNFVQELMRNLPAIFLFLLLAGCASDAPPVGSVIFVHPDGASAATWAAARALHVGPDADLNWDRLPAIAVYRGHMADCLTATSNGGGTTHAYGVKVLSDAYGTWGGREARPILDSQGQSASVARQALAAGLGVGLVQSGTSVEPGTGCFVASVPSRKASDQIAAELLASGAQVLLGGGEEHFLPQGVAGVHGPGKRTDGRNLIEEARAAGYTVVRTRQELLSLPAGTKRVLGLFAAEHTFNDKTEEVLAQKGLPLYAPEAPTLAEMTRAALKVLQNNGKQFLLVVEEEGTDNFGNKNNAAGVLEALRRADEALGVAREYVRRNPGTLLMTTADSDAGGMRMVGIPVPPGQTPPATLPATDDNGAPQDGVAGTGSAPFLAAPDAAGRRLPFAITWAARDDLSGGILVRAEGFNSHLVRGSMDNTRVAELMRLTLFGPWRASMLKPAAAPR